MREIIFRGKRMEDGKWVYGFYIKTQEYYTQDISNAILSADENQYGFGEYTFETYNKIDESTIGQYTGLKDKNGTKIFEGDIVKGAWNTKIVIYFDGNYLQFRGREVSAYAIESYIGYYDNGKMEIIGNIYDNPELLEVENE